MGLSFSLKEIKNSRGVLAAVKGIREHGQTDLKYETRGLSKGVSDSE